MAINNNMGQRRIFSLVVALLGCSPLMVLAADPTTQPAMDTLDVSVDPSGGTVMPPPVPDPGAAEEGKLRRPDRARPGLRFMQPYSSKELNDAMQFMQEHSPQRWKFIQALPDGERKTGIQNFAARAYQSWMRLSKDDFKLYAVVLKRVEIEDDIFGLVEDLRSVPPDKQDTIKDQLHDKVEALVDVGIKERQMRLDNLSHTIKDEQQKLDADAADRKSLVAKRLKTILTDDRAGRASDNFK